MSDKKFLLVTKKELFYSAVMLRIRRLVNIVYDFPADKLKFEAELRDARKTLRRKNLLEDSARDGVNISFSLSVCVSFCANPDKCEVIDSYGYYATIYQASKMYMLMELRDEDEDLLAAAWFTDRKKLDEYINSQIEKRRGAALK
ncbi:MAG: hypothetical protein IJG51_07755 [Synergistaceae bacterium]|nr:hypothetical protein [Synergistaceae bacterium]MBQ3398767.1 hypothetical protein [Synergistaceae bacterium]MBQ6002984.1 hypothetical protein [Synergistaceae bacterium]MBQ6981742.1 hypothetical protein [Synergistaceae bacterium]